jgi:hypothetical protein
MAGGAIHNGVATMKNESATMSKEIDLKIIDPVKTMLAEIEYGVSILRPHYPDANDDWLEWRAMAIRPKAYQVGRWPSDEEIVAIKMAEDEAAARAEAACLAQEDTST